VRNRFMIRWDLELEVEGNRYEGMKAREHALRLKFTPEKGRCSLGMKSNEPRVYVFSVSSLGVRKLSRC